MFCIYWVEQLQVRFGCEITYCRVGLAKPLFKTNNMVFINFQGSPYPKI